MRRLGVVIGSFICVAGVVLATPATAGLTPSEVDFTPGAAGVGDPYYPTDGNGGYDAKHYLLDLSYNPATDRLWGTATMRAVAKQNLSRFNLDLDGLTVHSVTINGIVARWWRNGTELVVKPKRGLRAGSSFTSVIRYGGVPRTIDDLFGTSGFIHTDDGAVIMGQPHGAATWYPVNDHPSDRASYTFAVRVPKGLTAVANGELTGHRTHRGWTTWNWDAKEPMASYLTTATMGEFDLRSYRKDGIRFWDAVDSALYLPVAQPTTGDRLLISQGASSSYKRLTRTLTVPAAGADLSFSVTRSTEPQWDFFFVEARTSGQEDWTTLEEESGRTTQDTGFGCPSWLFLHPALTHYVADNGDDTCSPSGTTGSWWAASGTSEAPEQWSFDLSAYAGSDVEISLSYASDESVQLDGVFVDDIVVSTGEGTTSFEEDGDTLDGWVAAGAPDGSPGNENDWVVGTADDVPTTGDRVDVALARQPEILAFEASIFGPYPFSAAGGIVDGTDLIQFALETQTRSNYAKSFFDGAAGGDSVVVHESAHQWFGDNLAVKRWKNIWLNEGFATYAEWLWAEHEGFATTDDYFFAYMNFPADDPFWDIVIGDPGTTNLFDFAVYARGALTLQALRMEVGDRAFFTILRRWADENSGGLVTQAKFQRLAEEVSGEDLGTFFRIWLFTPKRPTVEGFDGARVAFAGPETDPILRKQLSVVRHGLG